MIFERFLDLLGRGDRCTCDPDAVARDEVVRGWTRPVNELVMAKVFDNQFLVVVSLLLVYIKNIMIILCLLFTQVQSSDDNKIQDMVTLVNPGFSSFSIIVINIRGSVVSIKLVHGMQKNNCINPFVISKFALDCFGFGGSVRSTSTL